MKIDGYGQAKILTQVEIELLFNQGFTLNPPRDRALFAICLYTACRINECVNLKTKDVYDRRLKVRHEILLRKPNTKGKLQTRTIPVIEDLKYRLEQYRPPQPQGYLFPGQKGKREYLHPDSAGWILREACQRVGLEGVSTHSFRRTALTQMSNAGIPLRIIQEISGHRTLDELYKYLEIQEDQVRGAVASLSLLTPIESDQSHFGKSDFGEAVVSLWLKNQSQSDLDLAFDQLGSQLLEAKQGYAQMQEYDEKLFGEDFET